MFSSNSTNNFGISNYIVDATPGSGSFTTIQQAINAANASGLTTNIYIRPGTYTEDLTLFDKINFTSCGGNSKIAPVIIIGSHTLPLSGSVNFSNLNLVNLATSIFEDLVNAGSCNVVLDFCNISTNNYIFNLLNWSGNLELYNCTFTSSSMSLINNLGGSQVNILYCNSINPSSILPMNVSGSTTILDSLLGIPIIASSSTNFTMINCLLLNNITFNDTSSGSIINSLIFSNTSNALISNSTSINDILVQSSTLNSGIATVIDGSGGTVAFIVENTTYDNTGAVVPGTVIVSTSVNENGVLFTNNVSFDRGTTLLDTDGQLIIGNTGSNPSIATLTPGAGINVTNGSGSIILSTTASSVSTWNLQDTNTSLSSGNGYIAVSPGGVLLFSLPVTSSVGDIIEIGLFSATSWTVVQGAGQQIRLGNSLTTLGAVGSLTSSALGDSIRLVCVQANTFWQVLSVVGTITVV